MARRETDIKALIITKDGAVYQNVTRPGAPFTNMG